MILGDRRSVGGKSKPPHHCLSQALAAPTGERKGIRQYRPNFVFEPIANKLTRTVQAGFDGFWLDTKKFRGFLDAHSLDHARDEDQTEGFRQIVGRFLHKIDYLSLRHGSFRIIVRCRLRKLNNLRLALPLLQLGKIDG
jgi:hypothetical protein